MTAVSVNLTDGKSRPLSAEECSWFEAPLTIAEQISIVEVVFWGARHIRQTSQGPQQGAWIHLVRSRTARQFPLDGLSVEVSVDELPVYESWLAAQGV